MRTLREDDVVDSRPRAEVEAFALAMERELAANDDKGGWTRDSPAALLRRLRQEMIADVYASRDEEIP
jgi:hypothetical protein